MISFQPIRTARFTFTLQELNLGNIRALYDIAPTYVEKQRSAFLRYALKEFQWNKGFEHLTLNDLTVQERLFIEACYLSSVSDNPDFVLSNGHYTDFLLVEKQFKYDQLELGSIPDDDDVWFIRPLTGLVLESIEERVFAKEKVERLDFVLYAMAAQLFRQTEQIPDIHADFVQFGDWLDERVNTLLKLPESAMIALIGLFFSGQTQLTHLFAINFDHYGVYILPKPTEKGEEEAILPARFRPDAKFTTITQYLFGKFEQDEP